MSDVVVLDTGIAGLLARRTEHPLIAQTALGTKEDSMTIILELAPEVEACLRRKADRAGQEVADYLLAIADHEEEKDSEEEEAKGSAYDLFAGRLGGVHSAGQGRWSENTGEKFAAGMEEKRRQGHL